MLQNVPEEISSGEEDNAAPVTPPGGPARRLLPRESDVKTTAPDASLACSQSPRSALMPWGVPSIPERRSLRKLRRRPNGLSVLEAEPKPGEAPRELRREASGGGGSKRAATNNEDLPRRTYRRLVASDSNGSNVSAHDLDAEAVLGTMRTGFAEDFFLAKSCQHFSLASAEWAATAPPPTPAAELDVSLFGQPAEEVVARKGESWLQHMELGFSVLVQGVGSKRQLLETFADKVLLPWGASVLRIDGYQKRLSLSEMFRDLIERLHPGAQRIGHSAEALTASLISLRRTAPPPVRPLCLVVHNVECLPPAQQSIIASLVATPNINMIASVDSIWAHLVWTPRCLKDFNFFRDEVHTYQSYETEAAGRFPRGRPGWCDATSRRRGTQKAGLGLVLRSLTNSHRELIQAIAEHQLAAGGGRGSGMSTSRLLGIATDRMIASNVTKLRSLLNELRDHEVVAQRTAADGGILYHLPGDEQTLQRLSQGLAPEESDVEEDFDSDNDDA